MTKGRRVLPAGNGFSRRSDICIKTEGPGFPAAGCPGRNVTKYFKDSGPEGRIFARPSATAANGYIPAIFLNWLGVMPVSFLKAEWKSWRLR